MSQGGQKRGSRRSAKRRGRKLGEGLLRGRLLRLECLEVRRLLSLAPIISEVDPGNKSGITDTLPGNVSNTADWLEVYNPDPTTAVNLSGWEITKATGAPNNTWNFPSGVTLGPGAFRVVFCDSAAASTANGGDNYVTTETAFSELNTGFNLPKAGDTVSLFNPSVSTTVPVSSLVYPTLANDTSYGPMETVAETDLVAAGATASYYCPTNNSLGTTGRSQDSTLAPGRRAPRAWVSRTACPASPVPPTWQTMGVLSAAWRRPTRSSPAASRPPRQSV